MAQEACLLLAGDPSALRALAGAKPRSTFFCAHDGSSMNPTLCQRDLLEVAPYGPLAPRIGDVVLCLPPGADRAVVHRVTTLSAEGIRTRGDNNGNDDPWLLRPGDIVGRVIAAHRASRRRAIHGGRLGCGWALAVCWVARLRRRMLPALRPLRALVSPVLSGLGRMPVLPRAWRPRVVALGPPDRAIYRLMVGTWLAGQFDITSRRWIIRRPFRLWVDPSALPHPLTEVERGSARFTGPPR